MNIKSLIAVLLICIFTLAPIAAAQGTIAPEVERQGGGPVPLAHPSAQEESWFPSGDPGIDCPLHLGCEGLRQVVEEKRANCVSSEHVVWNSSGDVLSHVKIRRTTVGGECVEEKTAFQ